MGEIDRTEEIDALYVQHGTRLELHEGDFSATPWSVEGAGKHSVASQLEHLQELAESGAVALGAFDGERLVGIGVVRPHLRQDVAELAYLHVSDGYRGRGIGRSLCEELEAAARAFGDVRVVVSATPSRNTVRFYLRRGYEPMAEPLPELFELEPEDVHLTKPL